MPTEEETFDPSYCIRIVKLAENLKQWDLVADGALALIDWMMDTRGFRAFSPDVADAAEISRSEEQTMSFARLSLSLAIGNLAAQAFHDSYPEAPLGADVRRRVTEDAITQSFAKTDAKIRSTLLKIRVTLWDGQVGAPRWRAWAKLRTVFPG